MVANPAQFALLTCFFVRFLAHCASAAYWKMRQVLFATDPVTLEEARAALPPAARILADKVDDRQQMLLLCPAPLCVSTHQNGSESINAAMLMGYERGLHPTAFILRGECGVLAAAADAAAVVLR